MADVGFDNPAFEPDAWREDEDATLELPDPPVLTPSNTQQLEDPGDNIQNLRDEIHASRLNDRKNRLVKAYYGWVAEHYKLSPAEIPYDQFSIGEDGKTLYWTPEGGNKIQVSADRGGGEFLALGTLAEKYGRGGTDAIRKSLELEKYDSKTRKVTLSANGEKGLREAVDTLSTGDENIPLQDYSRVADAGIAGAGMTTTALYEELTPEQSSALETIDDPPLNLQ